jgi:hypothetical protein
LKVKIAEGAFPHKMIFGIHRVSDLGKLPYKTQLPEPKWLTSTNFSDFLSEFHEADNKLLAVTDIGCPEFTHRVVEVDLNKPEREHWREVVAAQDYMPSNGIQM